MSQPQIASRMPYVVEVERGKTYWWCACGLSKTQPWCDGSHQGSSFTPVKYQPRHSEKVWLCGCKRSRHSPMCDGAHNKLSLDTAPGGAYSG